MTEKAGREVRRGQRSLAAISEGLTQFYRTIHPQWTHVTVRHPTDLTAGWETDLYGFTLTYYDDHRPCSQCLVTRLYPGKHAAAKAQHEFDVITRLSEIGYPVPTVYDIETTPDVLGVPFITMDWITGHSLVDDFLGLPLEALGPHLKAFTRLFVDLHHLDPTRVFPDHPRFVDTAAYLDHALTRTRRDLEAYGPPWLAPVLDWLDAHKTKVSPGRLAVLHRDFHPANILVKADGSYAVIDWAAAAYGDVRADLMWTCLLASAFGGRPLGTAILKAYQTTAEEKVRDMAFFEVAAIYRRIQDTAISFLRGAEEASMRAGAVDQMRAGITHLYRVHDFLEESTGIRLAEFDAILGGSCNSQ